MTDRSTVWATLEQWSPVAFLLAGGLFALPPAATVLTALTGTEISVSPAVIFTFMAVVFVGLLGLYPGLAERNATLARGGLGLLAATTGVLIPTVGTYLLWSVPPYGEAVALAIVVTVAVGSTLTVATFGVATLRTETPSRLVGGFLLVMAGSISVMIVAMLAYGHSTPEGLGDVVNALDATSLGSIGYVLRSGNVPTESTDSSGDVVAG